MDRRRTPLIALAAWMPLVAALAFAAGSARTAAAVLLLGLGGYVASPLAVLITVPVAARARSVRRARAPDAPGHCCVH
jgi:hypothetical protein